MKPKISNAGIKVIEKAVSKLFDSLRSRLVGDHDPRIGKEIRFSYKPELTLKGIFDAAAAEEGTRPDADTFKGLAKITHSYLDAAEAKAKAKIVHSVQSFLADTSTNKIKTNFKNVLDGKLYEVMGDVKKDVKRIVETESTVVRNTSAADSIGKVNAAAGVSDPTVFFITVRDSSRCGECTRLHVQPDGVTPRVWKMSELGSEYHKKGDPNPKTLGLHPHCRCTIATLLPGFGFNKGGKIEYRAPGYDEYGVQRGIV